MAISGFPNLKKCSLAFISKVHFQILQLFSKLYVKSIMHSIFTEVTDKDLHKVIGDI